MHRRPGTLRRRCAATTIFLLLSFLIVLLLLLFYFLLFSYHYHHYYHCNQSCYKIMVSLHQFWKQNHFINSNLGLWFAIWLQFTLGGGLVTRMWNCPMHAVTSAMINTGVSLCVIQLGETGTEKRISGTPWSSIMEATMNLFIHM